MMVRGALAFAKQFVNGKFQVELESGLMRFKTVGDFIVGDITDSVVVSDAEAPNVGKTPSVGNF